MPEKESKPTLREQMIETQFMLNDALDFALSINSKLFGEVSTSSALPIKDEATDEIVNMEQAITKITKTLVVLSRMLGDIEKKI